MITAANKDIRSNQEKLSATAKLRALPDAMDTLRKASLVQSIIDNLFDSGWNLYLIGHYLHSISDESCLPLFERWSL
ncbi:Transcription factor iws1 [Stygiomarasmius scandens]|uniref:Transcription factor iws1 n=1 Tax=Marasmiellus scandens TaxID=2682957 RepID=A0ABR1J160_9AGAR